MKSAPKSIKVNKLAKVSGMTTGMMIAYMAVGAGIVTAAYWATGTLTLDKLYETASINELRYVGGNKGGRTCQDGEKYFYNSKNQPISAAEAEAIRKTGGQITEINCNVSPAMDPTEPVGYLGVINSSDGLYKSVFVDRTCKSYAKDEDGRYCDQYNVSDKELMGNAYIVTKYNGDKPQNPITITPSVTGTQYSRPQILHKVELVEKQVEDAKNNPVPVQIKTSSLNAQASASLIPAKNTSPIQKLMTIIRSKLSK